MTAEVTTPVVRKADWKMFSMWAPGTAIPQGSKRIGRHGRHPVILDANDAVLGPWRERVALAADEAMRRQYLAPVAPKVPLKVELEFILPRLASAPKTKDHPPATSKPDLDKLIRSILDALTGSVMHDDAQVIRLVADKRRAEVGEPPGVNIVVERLTR